MHGINEAKKNMSPAQRYEVDLTETRTELDDIAATMCDDPSIVDLIYISRKDPAKAGELLSRLAEIVIWNQAKEVTATHDNKYQDFCDCDMSLDEAILQVEQRIHELTYPDPNAAVQTAVAMARAMVPGLKDAG